MAKIRKLASIENGLTEVIKILTEDEIEEAMITSSHGYPEYIEDEKEL